MAKDIIEKNKNMRCFKPVVTCIKNKIKEKERNTDKIAVCHAKYATKVETPEEIMDRKGANRGFEDIKEINSDAIKKIKSNRYSKILVKRGTCSSMGASE